MSGTMKTIAIIPARSGSKGVPDKNIKLLAGKPLLAYSIAAARLTKNIDRIIVSTDSEHYADIAKDYGAETPFIRPATISGDKSGDYEWIKHTLDWMQANEGYMPEYLVHLRPTTPLREISCIQKAIEKIKGSKDSTALRSVHEMPETSYKTFEIESPYLKAVFSGSFDIEKSNQPRQMFQKTYEGNGYVDIIKASHLLKNKKVHGNKVLAHITPFIAEVDVLEDFNYLEYQVKKNPTLVSRLFNN